MKIIVSDCRHGVAVRPRYMGSFQCAPVVLQKELTRCVSGVALLAGGGALWLAAARSVLLNTVR